jgi:hypothetical protein
VDVGAGAGVGVQISLARLHSLSPSPSGARALTTSVIVGIAITGHPLHSFKGIAVNLAPSVPFGPRVDRGNVRSRTTGVFLADVFMKEVDAVSLPVGPLLVIGHATIRRDEPVRLPHQTEHYESSEVGLLGRIRPGVGHIVRCSTAL